jgi:hypothetical protein
VVGVSVSGNGNSVTITQGITQTASNQNTQVLVLLGAMPPPIDLSSRSQLSEALSLTKAPSTLATSISPGSSVPAGTAVRATATVTGNAPTGTISFTFFNNGTCTGSGTPAGTISLAVASPATATAASNSVTPTTPGSYAFIASYSGDASNTPSTGACEPLTVR